MHPADPVILYTIELHSPGTPSHSLGVAGEIESARRAAVSQASRLQLGGRTGEVVVIELPAGTVVARESVG
jgi:hypothetical protein